MKAHIQERKLSIAETPAQPKRLGPSRHDDQPLVVFLGAKLWEISNKDSCDKVVQTLCERVRLLPERGGLATFSHPAQEGSECSQDG
ncbi:hypothetical protein GCM10009674_13680 [Nesterenkonia xinjiangensis]